MKISLPDHIKEIIEKLNSHGYLAYLVGGCVRDSLLSLSPEDFDIATDALPFVHKKLFSPMKVVETGIKHGTVTVITQGGPVEITTFRTDGRYTDNRHPEGVTFTGSLTEDLSRRDFTINALAYHPESGIIDLFGGRDDLEKGIIRTVGDAHARFNEDALRILRALRFCSVLNFQAEKETALAATELKDLIQNISRERILSELKKLICGKNADNVLSEFSSVINTALGTSGLSFKKSLNDLPPLCDIRFAALLSDLKSSDAKQVLQNLKSEKALSTSVEVLLGDIGFLYENSVSLKKFISEKGYLHAEKLAQLKKNNDFLRDILRIKEENPCLFIKDLAVNGTDLQKLGIKSENIGKILNALLSLVIEGNLLNKRAFLLAEAEKLNNAKAL